MTDEVVPVRFREASKTTAVRLRGTRQYKENQKNHRKAVFSLNIKEALARFLGLAGIDELYPYVRTEEQNNYMRVGGLGLGPTYDCDNSLELFVIDAETIRPLPQKEWWCDYMEQNNSIKT
jgi:hypothetical protein